MEFQNQSEQKNNDEFLTLKNCKVHHTEYTDVLAQLVTINGNIYVGLQRKSYYEDKNNPRLKNILLPIEAWSRFVRQAVTNLEKAITDNQVTHTPPSGKPMSR